MDEGTLEDQAQQRRARLKALRAKKKTGQSEGKDEDNQAQDSSKPKLKFRSYNPQTEDLKERKLPKAKPEVVEPQIQEQLDAAKDTGIKDVNLTNLAPKKVDWDLKRDISKKLERLERRTQRAIVELIRERLQESEGDDLALAVATAGREQQESD